MPLSRSYPALCAFVIPCFDEEEVLPFSNSKLLALLTSLIQQGKCSTSSYILFIDDGSRDNTWSLIETFHSKSRYIRAIKLSQNVGHQAALMCGLDYVQDKCDFAISIDSDLQDDINVIPEMISKWYEGSDLVFGVRKSRGNDTFFKRNSAILYYKLAKKLGVKLIENHADFRLISRQCLHHLSKFTEVNLFLRGLAPLLSKATSIVRYERQDRIAGHSKYPILKMMALSWDGITSFSTFPLRLISILSFIIFFSTLMMTAYAVYGVVNNSTMPGWASTVIPLYLLGGIITLSISILGEYVGKIILETKQRPRYLINEIL